MKKKKTVSGFMLTGRLRQSGVTIYQRNGQMVTRTATSYEKRSNTLPQFIQRQKMRHTTALWKLFQYQFSFSLLLLLLAETFGVFQFWYGDNLKGHVVVDALHIVVNAGYEVLVHRLSNL